MIATHTADFLEKLRRGAIDEADTRWLEQVSAHQLVDELEASRYRLTFQERHIGKKWEKSLARSLRAELAARPVPDAIFASFLLIPAYVDCLVLNMEDDRITGISRFNRLTVWAVAKPERGLALKTGRGFKLDLTPDGWESKPIRNRIVKLSSEFLRKRGWRFDHLAQLIPVPS